MYRRIATIVALFLGASLYTSLAAAQGATANEPRPWGPPPPETAGSPEQPDDAEGQEEPDAPTAEAPAAEPVVEDEPAETEGVEGDTEGTEATEVLAEGEPDVAPEPSEDDDVEAENEEPGNDVEDEGEEAEEAEDSGYRTRFPLYPFLVIVGGLRYQHSVPTSGQVEPMMAPMVPPREPAAHRGRSTRSVRPAAGLACPPISAACKASPRGPDRARYTA